MYYINSDLLDATEPYVRDIAIVDVRAAKEN